MSTSFFSDSLVSGVVETFRSALELVVHGLLLVLEGGLENKMRF